MATTTNSSPSLMTLKLFAVVLLGYLALTPGPAGAAIGCSTVVSSLYPCLSFFSSGQLGSGCCAGIKSLNSQANSTPNRQSVCNCLKSLEASSSFNVAKAQQLVKKCGVNLPYPLDPNTDCSKVTELEGR